ncbi:MAG: hypothetical protein JWM08_2424 [Candidatus Angelobacter sp.]|nr:hypothetical protein [Candidatus Angelobacter sp.]
MTPIGFVNEILFQVNAIRRELLGKPPATLFHYTNLRGVLGIANSRIVRAMCVTGLNDDNEIHYGVNLVEVEISKVIRSEISQTTKAILNEIPEQLRTGISRTFVACFCANPASAFHWNSYGPYCLRFETDANREPLLRVSVSAAQVGYFRAIYGEEPQQVAINRALKTVISAVDRNTQGVLEGPWAKSTTQFLARNASELLLDLIVAFKKVEFEDDAEWRLAVRPKSALVSSSPNVADQNFDVLVKRETKEFVELQKLRSTNPFQNFAFRSPVPFAEVIQSPLCNDPGELELIRSFLDENGRTDIKVAMASR